MPSNYREITENNEKRYGTEIGRIGKMLLADRYDDRTHFIFELLQNAEDALNRRGESDGSRQVTFALEPGRVTLSHFGRPFDEADVRGVCGIAESTKDETSIGRFGIGFKSVYTFTDCPEIHSGDEDFVIENYVRPAQAKPITRHKDETVIVLPLLTADQSAEGEIISGFKRIGPGALLFLRQIEEIHWTAPNGQAGAYMRSAPESLTDFAHRITVIGESVNEDDTDQTWMVFHREVATPAGVAAGRVEVAFQLKPDVSQKSGWSVAPVSTSPLVVFFPTALETNLGFLVQGPFKTTPSRDNIPKQDPWNKHLVSETAELLVDGLRWMRDEEMLNVSTLECLPLDADKFPDGSMFATLFNRVLEVFAEEPLLPTFDGSYVSAKNAKLGRTRELRELFSPQQLSQLYEREGLAWLAGEITPDRAKAVRDYVVYDLDVDEVTPDLIVSKLNQEFLEAQSDEWISRLYVFLNGQPAVRKRFSGNEPLVRLLDGQHVPARLHGEPRAFLPSGVQTGFPTVKPAVCADPEAREFLASLGVTTPDPIDDVIIHVLAKYRSAKNEITAEVYSQDIARIVTASKADSVTEGQKNKLESALRQTRFVRVVDTADGTNWWAKPEAVYIATTRLKSLFDGVSGIHIVDSSFECLRGEGVRELLERCGALRYMRPKTLSDMSHAERVKFRRAAGHESTSGINDLISDWKLEGLDELLALLPSLPKEQRKERSKLLWESLCELEDRRGHSVFRGTYTWTHHGRYETSFHSAFVRRLQDTPWVPDCDGELRCPSLVSFESLGWQTNSFLLEHIKFKPGIIDQLAQETGIDPAALDLLRAYGITSVDDLKARLGLLEPFDAEGDEQDEEAAQENSAADASDVYDEASDLYGEDMPDIPPGSHDPEGGGGPGQAGVSGGSSGETAKSGQSSGGNRGGKGVKDTHSATGGRGKGSPAQSAGMRPFFSYLGAHPNEVERDPDGLAQEVRMTIEAQAIDALLKNEPALLRTPPGNPGFDLYEVDEHGNETRWIEVKSMTGTLDNRPAGLTRAQFEMACAKRGAYWLYVVENATDMSSIRVLKIQDPAGRARTFTFDKGWRAIGQKVMLASKSEPDSSE